MIRYTDVELTFAEIPNEINLCFSISNCSGVCENCHSPELRDDVGQSLEENIEAEISRRRGITCVCFLGEARKIPNVFNEWNRIISIVRKKFPKLKIAIYSGRQEEEIEEEMWQLFDYIKVGPYIPSFGSLENPRTNQKLFQIDRKNDQKNDITNLFWRKSLEHHKTR